MSSHTIQSASGESWVCTIERGDDFLLVTAESVGSPYGSLQYAERGVGGDECSSDQRALRMMLAVVNAYGEA